MFISQLWSTGYHDACTFKWEIYLLTKCVCSCVYVCVFVLKCG